MTKQRVLRWSAAFSLVGVTLHGSGCSSMRAAFNPSAVWAIGESTPLVVVMDRSQTATELSARTAQLLRELPVEQASAEALVMLPPQARTLMEQNAAELSYVGQPVRVVAAEAWTRKLAPQCLPAEDEASGADPGGLMETLGESTATQFDKVDETVRTVAEHKAQLILLRRDQRKAKGDEKKAFAPEIEATKDRLRALKKELQPEIDALLAQVSAAAAQLDTAQGELVAGLSYNLLAAVKDAEVANAAATVRYPLAMTKILDDLKAQLPRMAADVVEQQTGQRPDLQNLDIGVKLEEGNVKLDLAGVDVEALGKLDPAALIKETTLRAQAYVTRAFTLPRELNQTAEQLRFQRRILAAITKQLPPPPTGVTDLKSVQVAVSTGPATEHAETTETPEAASCGIPPAELARVD